MKRTGLSLAVAATLGALIFSGPALAQNKSNFTAINTFDSAFFGFVPTAANIDTFMQKDAASNADGLLGTFDDYLKNGQMPGAYTQRPDKVVSVNPDFGCGAQVTSGTACDESVLNIEDRVNGNTTSANLGGAVLGNGQNTAPTSQTPTGGGGPSGVLIGDYTSEVYLESTESGMPSGSIVFHRTDGSDGSIEADFDQLVSLDITGFQTFSEHDRTENDLGPTNFVVIPCPLTPQCVTGSAAFPGIVTGQVGSRHSGATGTLSGSFPHSNLGIRTTLSLTQARLGGDGAGTESIGYTVDWQGNGTYPTPGAYFTPGLNVSGGDWLGDGVVGDTNGFPN